MNKILIYGGLGNQMFQYALCVAQKKKGIKAGIYFANFFYQKYHNGFNLIEAFQLKLSPFEHFLLFLLRNFAWFSRLPKISTALERFLSWYQKKRYTVYKEKKEFIYDQQVVQPGNHLLIGTWQAEEYFKDLEETLWETFKFKIPTDKKNQDLIEQIKGCNAVSIHVRRGDYLHSHWNATHGVIRDETYYMNAVSYLDSRLENPQYFVFSDDIQWAKEHLELPNSVYIDHNVGKKSYIDIYLMSLCKHNIIANSTFSWWGAWLNKHQDKIVIMPEKWLNHRDCKGIYPSRWIKMSVNKLVFETK